MKFFYLLLLLFCFIAPSFSQSFNESIGIRGGNISGITYKKMIDEEIGIEAIASFDLRLVSDNILIDEYYLQFNSRLDGLYEFHKPFEQHPEWSLHYGFGGGVQVIRSAFQKVNALSGLGIIGVSYAFENYPFIISINNLSRLSLGLDYTVFRFSDAAFTFRYVLK